MVYLPENLKLCLNEKRHKEARVKEPKKFLTNMGSYAIKKMIVKFSFENVCLQAKVHNRRMYLFL